MDTITNLDTTSAVLDALNNVIESTSTHYKTFTEASANWGSIMCEFIKINCGPSIIDTLNPDNLHVKAIPGTSSETALKETQDLRNWVSAFQKDQRLLDDTIKEVFKKAFQVPCSKEEAPDYVDKVIKSLDVKGDRHMEVLTGLDKLNRTGPPFVK